MSIDISALGPLAVLAGEWEGAKGLDQAPGDDRYVSAESAFREHIVFEPIGSVTNHEQVLHGLRYSLKAWRLGEEDAFHQETGYWHWDPAARQVMRTFGICSNPFLDEEFQTARFEMRVSIHEQNSYSYDQDTVIRIKGREDMFHHRDSNTLRRV